MEIEKISEKRLLCVGEIDEHDPKILDKFFHNARDSLNSLFIASSGGSLTHAFLCAKLIDEQGIDQMIGGKRVDSAALILYASGKERFASPETGFYLHPPEYPPGTPEYVLKRARELVVKQIHEKTGIESAVFDGLLLSDMRLSAYQAKDLGLVHKIV